jgi:exodeoxyribonuclease V beta subunit
MWTGTFNKPEDVRFHDRDDGDRVKLDLGSTAYDAHRKIAEREELAESLRLLYVALTRAEHRCYAVWGRFYKSGSSPLGYLLHPDPAAAEPGDVEARLATLSDAQLRAELQALCESSGGSIGLRELRSDAPARYQASERAPGTLAARTAAREHSPWPRMTSFSRITADAADAEQHARAAEVPDHDEGAAEAPERAPAADAEPEQPRIAMHSFPSSSRHGSLIHGIYEHIDFARADPAELAAEAERHLALYGVPAALHRDALVRGLELSLLTPLDAGTPPLTLARIARDARVDELEFTLSTSARPPSPLSERLADAFVSCGAPACDPGYEQRLRALGSVPPAGFVKGFMDLVFRHEGRFYVADYKSNRLGDHAGDYAQAQLVRSMREHHYFLQYHLYVLALHRHLALRVPDYDYERHFGGVYYLYVRGMSPDHAPGTGVFFDRPPRVLIDALSAALGAADERVPA